MRTTSRTPLRRLVLAVLVAWLGPIGLGACASMAPPAPTDGPETAGTHDPLGDVLASGTLRVALSGDQPPFNMKGRDGELLGLDVDLARALAAAMGLEAKLVTMPFGRLLAALEQGDADVVISALTITPARNARVPFAGPYYVSGTAALTKSDALARVEDPSTLDDPERRIAAVSGTTNERFVRDYLPSARLVSTPSFDEAVALVLSDEVDVVLADFPLCKYAAMKHPDAGFSDRMTPFTVEPLGIAIRADAPLLVNLVDNYLDTLEYAGLLGAMKARWLGDDAWLEQMP